MAEVRYRANLYRLLHGVGLWEVSVVELTSEPGKAYAQSVVGYRDLNSGVGMAPSICDRNVALRDLGFEVARYQAWDWVESSIGHSDPTELVARVRVSKLPTASAPAEDEEEYRDAGA